MPSGRTRKTKYGTTGAPSGDSDICTRSSSRAMAMMTGLERGLIIAERSSIENVGPLGRNVTVPSPQSSTIGRRQLPLGPL
jgi:hypothetical protein